MKPDASYEPAYSGDPPRMPLQPRAKDGGLPLCYLSRYRVRESSLKRLLLPVRRFLWKVIDQFTTPRHRALQRLYQELADIKSALATLEGQRSTSPAGSGSQGVAINASNPWAPQASWNSLAFATEFRGKFHDIKESQRDYLDYFIGEGPFLDIGCGRGEFLELLKERGQSAVGVELDPVSVGLCRDRGLEVHQVDALEFLRGLPDAYLVGVFSAQVVEHLEPAYLVDVVNTIRAKLKPGGVLALETINPASLYAMNNAFYLDPSHVRPVHPQTLKFIVDQAGYYPVEVAFRSPVDPYQLLEEVPVSQVTSAIGRDTVKTLNRNLHRLNNLLYGYQDYALIGWRPNTEAF